MDIITKTISAIIITLIKLYQGIVSPFFVGSCRHIPTCSQYAIDAIGQYGPIKGLYFSLKRIIRCRPQGTCGYDPVPSKDEK